ncbi:MAG: MerR family transcriptional regulator, partial [Legionellales bacterium RIFCSPHIGHO2_12_FULL_35_11]
MRTFDIIEAANFLGTHKETVRRMVAGGQLPGVKIGKSWRFLQDDLVFYMRSKYARVVTSQGAAHRSNKQWR